MLQQKSKTLNLSLTISVSWWMSCILLNAVTKCTARTTSEASPLELVLASSQDESRENFHGIGLSFESVEASGPTQDTNMVIATSDTTGSTSMPVSEISYRSKYHGITDLYLGWTLLIMAITSPALVATIAVLVTLCSTIFGCGMKVKSLPVHDSLNSGSYSQSSEENSLATITSNPPSSSMQPLGYFMNFAMRISHPDSLVGATNLSSIHEDDVDMHVGNTTAKCSERDEQIQVKTPFGMGGRTTVNPLYQEIKVEKISKDAENFDHDQTQENEHPTNSQQRSLGQENSNNYLTRFYGPSVETHNDRKQIGPAHNTMQIGRNPSFGNSTTKNTTRYPRLPLTESRLSHFARQSSMTSIEEYSVSILQHSNPNSLSFRSQQPSIDHNENYSPFVGRRKFSLGETEHDYCSIDDIKELTKPSENLYEIITQQEPNQVVNQTENYSQSIPETRQSSSQSDSNEYGIPKPRGIMTPSENVYREPVTRMHGPNQTENINQRLLDQSQTVGRLGNYSGSGRSLVGNPETIPPNQTTCDDPNVYHVPPSRGELTTYIQMGPRQQSARSNLRVHNAPDPGNVYETYDVEDDIGERYQTPRQVERGVGKSTY